MENLQKKKEKLIIKHQNITAQLTSTFSEKQNLLFAKFMQTSEQLNKLQTLEVINSILKSKKDWFFATKKALTIVKTFCFY